MIDKESLTAGWINRVSKDNRNADKILVEKVIRAMLLAEGLSKQKLPFVFKGGTALMLLMDSAKRLSIDIDIILPETPENLDDILNNVAGEQGFIRKELNHRNTELKIPKEHYKFFYTPVHTSGAAEESILLDILFEEVNYQQVNLHPVQSKFLISSSKPIDVSIPSFEDILGDKLTAFAPNTTGIPYFKKEDSMSMEIIKQLYDIGNLLDMANDAGIIKSTFFRFAEVELAYRNQNKLNAGDVLEDIFQTALCISTRGDDGKGDFEQLQSGIQRLGRFIFSESYHLEKAIPHAAKAAYLSRLIATNQKTIEKFENPAQVADAVIGAPHHPRLQKLKKTNPEAFFYWWKAINL